jgi:hypothetical protein
MARGLDFTEGATPSVPSSVENQVPTTVSGGTSGTISSNDAGSVSDSFTVTFDSPSEVTITGSSSGNLGTFSDLSVAISPDNSGNPYFTIPANFFDGSWLAGETFEFDTVAFVAGSGGSFSDNHTGEIKLGSMKSPAFMRVEAVYTYPNQVNHMYIVFPRANAASSVELEFQQEEGATVPITYESKRADDEVAGGNSVWNDMPLGRIYFD